MIHETRIQDSPRTDIGTVPSTVYEPALPRSGFMSLAAWGAVLAGVVVAIASQILLTVLGMAIGLSVIAGDAGTGEGIAIGAGIWWLVTGLISLFIGGLVAGWCTNTLSSFVGGLHGLVAWCTVTVISALLVTGAAGNILGGGLSVMANTLQGNTGMQTSNQASDQGSGQVTIDRQALRTDVQEFIQDNQQNQDQVQQQPPMQNVDRIVTDVEPALRQQNTSGPAYERAVQSLVTNANVSRNEAEQTIRQWRMTHGSGLNVTARDVEEATGAAAGGAWWTLIALVLGAGVATIGGAVGANRGFDSDRNSSPRYSGPRRT